MEPQGFETFGDWIMYLMDVLVSEGDILRPEGEADEDE